MAFVITDDCVSCGACQSACPTGAIKEGDDHFEISSDCVGCGACLDACPTGAIKEG